MKRETVVKAFKEVKKVVGLDFAQSTAKCCNSCSWGRIETKYGENAKGIFLKFFTSGLNRQPWDEERSYYISHSLTEEQAFKVIEVLRKYFKTDWDGDMGTCIEIQDYKEGEQE